MPRTSRVWREPPEGLQPHFTDVCQLLHYVTVNAKSHSLQQQVEDPSVYTTAEVDAMSDVPLQPCWEVAT